MGKTIRRERTPDDDDELTEITKMHAPRVDLVGAGAVGFDFILAKSAEGLMTPDQVLELAKRAESTANINDLPDSDFAYIESGGTKDDTGKTTPRSLRHFPIMDAAHVRNALARASSSPFGEKAMPKIKAAAEKFGIDQHMEKADDQTVDVDELEDSDVDASGDPNDPGSPAWEAMDAARAAQAIELVVALRTNLQAALDREAAEALVGDDPEDAENVWNLQSALDASDCILGVLAPFAVTEQAEADNREDDDSIVLKSGRVLSGVNEGRIRQASDLLTSVLQTMEPVAKAEDDPVELVVKAEDGEESQLVLVYTADGQILGAVDPDAITTFAPTPAGKPAEADGTDTTADAVDPTDTPDTPDVPADSADEREIPGTDTVQSPVEAAPAADEEDVKKGQNDNAPAWLEDALAPLRKALEERDERLEAMQKRLDAFGKMPDDRNSPVRNGAVGPVREVARGELVNDEASLIKQAQDETDVMARQPLLHQILKGRV